MRELRRREPDPKKLRFVDFEQALDDYIRLLPQKDKADVAKDFEGFKQFYFDHNDDPARRQVIEDYLKAR